MTKYFFIAEQVWLQPKIKEGKLNILANYRKTPHNFATQNILKCRISQVFNKFSYGYSCLISDKIQFEILMEDLISDL